MLRKPPQTARQERRAKRLKCQHLNCGHWRGELRGHRLWTVSNLAPENVRSLGKDPGLA